MRLVIAKDPRDAKNLAVSIIVSVPCVIMIRSAEIIEIRRMKLYCHTRSVELIFNAVY